MTVLQKLKDRCKEKGITITSLCLKSTGNKGNLQTWKNNNGHMRSDYLANCADILECSTDYLLGLSDTPERQSQYNPIYSTYNSLNDLGKQKARAYLEDLAVNPKYLSTKPSDDLQLIAEETLSAPTVLEDITDIT